MELPKLSFTGFTSVLAGFIVLATGVLLMINSMSTVSDTVNPSVITLVGLATAIVGLVILTARDE